ncbi:MAG: YihY/virulence factor BrkB family protein [Lachnospiraceae bacterium]|nr:YihY/virulence factor BrkB family protein [Lachnospiraceae bacterium]
MKNSLKAAISKIRSFSKTFKIARVSTYASSAAFYIFLSIIPIIVLLFTIIPYTPLTQEGVLKVLLEILPDSLDAFTTGIVAEVYDKNVAILSVSAVILLWSASKGMQAITLGLNSINGVKETRNFFLLRLEACLYTVILLVLMIISLGLFVFGSFIIDHLVLWMHVDKIYQVLVDWRFLVEWIFYAIPIAFLYAWVPNRRTRPHTQWRGAAFTGVTWTLFSYAFSLYLSIFPAFSIYGSLTTVIITMFWLFVAMNILFLGALINVFFEESDKKAEDA